MVHSIQHLRDLRVFFGTTFKIKPVINATLAASTTDFILPPPHKSATESDEEDSAAEEDGDESEDEDVESRLKAMEPAEEFILSCVGTGYTNTARKTSVSFSLRTSSTCLESDPFFIISFFRQWINSVWVRRLFLVCCVSIA